MITSQGIRHFLFAALLLFAAGAQAQEKPADKPKEASFASPRQAYEAFAKAHLDRNWSAAFQCITPRFQDHYAFESVFAFGMLGPDRYEKLGLRTQDDLKKFFRDESDAPSSRKEPDPANHEESRKYVASMVKDKSGFYGLPRRLDADSSDPFDWKTPLGKVVVIKDRARGVVTSYIVSLEKKPGEPAVKHKTTYDRPFYFQKTKAGWLLDLPTEEESKAVVEGHEDSYWDKK